MYHTIFEGGWWLVGGCFSKQFLTAKMLRKIVEKPWEKSRGSANDKQPLSLEKA